MLFKAVFLAALLAYAEARFGNEQATQAQIAAVQGGAPGQAATIAGASISDLLGAASACDKLATADQIVSELGGGQDAIDAAIAHVAAEKNTNPSANGNAQKVCADPSLPATAELRGITPLIDPAVDVDGAVAALSAQTQAQPLDATGKSQFDLLVDAGFGDLVVADGGAGGADGNAGGNAGGNANQGNANQDNANQGNDNKGNDNSQADAGNGNNQAGDGVDCNDGAADAGNQNGNAAGGQSNNQKKQKQGNNKKKNKNQNQNQQNANQGNNNQNQNQQNADQGNNNYDNNNQNNQAAAGGNAAGAADFGLCTPTIIFEAGVNNRAADEFTFQIADPLARGGQGEALNPAIITNALCNQLINVCEANDAAVTSCRDAEKQALALGTRDKAVADTFNAAIGFAGAVTNPSGGPADVNEVKRRGVVGMRFRA